ncbi:PIN domain-containing protein [Gemmatimonas groenlandica]|uniref:PIN domain-containing protein n=1 Tax=Gemmatimonas groenlandica TaxID=2732249 RepID=A0A6M4ISR6_9BACT|nr:PIN domain-containing protein [Gemmatimonas groenlandica]QJR37834.1 PIN domain-containing protein [Gemmatimonas groenlandica]
MSVGLDTSVVLRLLTGAPAKQADAARRMLAASRDTICVSDLVVSESYFALRHHYAVPHADAAHAMAALLDDPRIQCTGVSRHVLRDSTARASRSAPGLMDQLILADYRANLCTIATFDRELSKADGAQLVV